MATGDVSVKYDTKVTFTITNLNSMANSATSMWCSAVVDNSSNLYLDAHVFIKMAMANTAPANSKAAFIYAYGSLDNTTYTYPANGAEGAQTIVNFTTSPLPTKLIGVVPYNTTNETLKGGPFSVAQAFGGVLPKYWGIGIVDYTGAAVQASGNEIAYMGIKSAVSP